VLNVDTELGRVCTAGWVRADDGDVRVVFSYEAIGDIRYATRTKLKARSVSGSLTLEISGGTISPYEQTIEPNCTVKSKLRGRGARDRVRIVCELGEQFAAFPGLDPQQIASIDAAFTNQQRAWAKSKNGLLRVNHYGVPVDGAGFPSCELPGLE